MRTVALSALLLLAAVTSVAAPPLRPEIPLGSLSREAVASRDVSAASSGTDAFAVWNDSRRGVAVGTPIDVDGQLTARWGIQLGDGRVPPNNAIAWTGDSYLVVLLGYLPNGGCCTPSSILVDRDGTIRRPAVPLGSGDTAYVWANSKRVLLLLGSKIAFLDPVKGTATDIGQLPVGTRQLVTLVRGSGFTVYALDSAYPDRVLHRIYIDNSGAVSDKPLRLEWQQSTNFAAATDGQNDLLVWDQYSPGPRYTIWAMLLDAEGVAKADAAAVLQHQYRNTSGSPYWAAVTTAGWDGRQFAVGYVESYGGGTASLGLKGVTPDGRPTSTAETIIDRSDSGLQTYPLTSILLSTGQPRLLLWCSARNSGSGIVYVTFFRAFDSYESIDSSVTQTLAGGPSAQGEPAVSADGTMVAAAWRQSNFSPAIVAQVVNARGEPSTAVTLATASISSNISAPVIASGDGAHLVAWREFDTDDRNPINYRIVSCLLRSDGTAGTPMVLQSGTYTPLLQGYAVAYLVSVAWNGTNFVVVWTGATGQPYLARISVQGERLDIRPLFPAGGPAETFNIRAVKAGDDVFALYFARDSKVFGTAIAIEGVRISKNGSIGEPVTFVGAFESVNSAIPFSAASDGKDLLIAWEQRATVVLPESVFARRFHPDGAPGSAAMRLGNGVPTKQSIGQFIYDDGSWWFLTRLGQLAPVAQKLGPNLEMLGEPIEIAARQSSPLDAVGVLQNQRLITVYPRVAEFAPGAVGQRLFMQWTLLGSRERAVRR